MIHYRFAELAGTADDGDLEAVEDIYRDTVAALKKAGFSVGGSLIAHDTDIENSAIALPALDVEDKPTKQQKAVRARYAELKKARKADLEKGTKEAQAEAKRQKAELRRTGDRGAGEVVTGDTSVRTATGDRGVTAAIEAGPTKAKS